MMRKRLRRWCWLNVILIAAMVWCGLPPWVQAQALSPRQQDPVKLLERFFDVAQEELKKPGADPSDIEGKAAALNHDPQKIFEFLRDKSALEPYEGVLRGARGTLAAEAGNALDRALLAQALLKASRIESRLVAGQLSDAQTQTLLSRFLALNPVRGPLSSCVQGADAKEQESLAFKIAAKVGLPSEQLKTLLRSSGARAEAFWWKTDEERASQYDFLTNTLQNAGVKSGVNTTKMLATLKQRLKRHYWLQVKGSDGAWADFDPAFADSKQGVAYAATAAALTTIPKDQFHCLEFSLVYHTMAQGKSKQEILLHGTFDSANTLFEPLEFRLQPAEGLPEASSLLAMDEKQQIEVIQKIKRFQGVLRSGSRVIGGRPFDLEGNTYDVSSDGRLEGATKVGRAAGGLMGGLAGAFSGDEEAQQQQDRAKFVELQMRLCLKGPGRDPVTQTRTVLRAGDLNGPNSALPMMEAEILLQPQWISSNLAAYQQLLTLCGFRGFITDALAPSRQDKPIHVPVVLPFPRHLLKLALLRQSATVEILRRQVGVSALIDAPLLTIADRQVCALLPKDGLITTRLGIDIVQNAVSFIGRDGRSQSSAYEAALSQGVADCTLESLFLAETNARRVTSGRTVFGCAKLEGSPPLVIGPQQSDKLRSLGISEQDIEWIRVNESPASHIIITKTASGLNAWWSVRPDGNSILRTHEGRGGSDTEYLVVTLKIGFLALCLFETHLAASYHKTALAMGGAVFCIVLTGLGFGIHFAANAAEAAGTVAELEWAESADMVCNLLLAGEALIGTVIAVGNDSARMHEIDLRDSPVRPGR
jgi:hypothetical protein